MHTFLIFATASKPRPLQRSSAALAAIRADKDVRSAPLEQERRATLPGSKFLLEAPKGVPRVERSSDVCRNWRGRRRLIHGPWIISSPTGSAAIRALVPSASAVGPIYLLDVQVKIEACTTVHLYYWSRLGPKVQESSAARAWR
jgi:hypothetical protein